MMTVQSRRSLRHRILAMCRRMCRKTCWRIYMRTVAYHAAELLANWSGGPAGISYSGRFQQAKAISARRGTTCVNNLRNCVIAALLQQMTTEGVPPVRCYYLLGRQLQAEERKKAFKHQVMMAKGSDRGDVASLRRLPIRLWGSRDQQNMPAKVVYLIERQPLQTTR